MRDIVIFVTNHKVNKSTQHQDHDTRFRYENYCQDNCRITTCPGGLTNITQKPYSSPNHVELLEWTKVPQLFL